MNDKIKIENISINSKGYGIIPKLVMQDKRLNINAKAIYSYFRSFTGEGIICFPSRDKICSDLGISKDTFNKYLKELCEFNYLSMEQVRENGKFSHNVYTIYETVYENTVYENIGHDKLATNNNNSIIKNNNNNKKENKKENSKEINDIINEVIRYMNELGGTSFKSTTEKTKKLIIARLKEGFDIEEIKDVIFFKYKMWVEDEKEFSNGVLSSNYYRPDTLFGTKFESYLQEYKRQL